MLDARVTGLAEFSPFGPIVFFGRFYENYENKRRPNVWATFFHGTRNKKMFLLFEQYIQDM
jgi:hypothetical protein